MVKQQSPRRVATIVWGALVAGVLMFLGVALFLRMRGAPGLVEVLLPVAGGLSVVSTAISWLWAVRMKVAASPAVTRGDFPPSPEAHALTRLIVASALCEGPSLFAIVGLLVTGDRVMLLPFAVSFVALVAHFPGDRHWAQLVGDAAGGPPGRNRMMRG